MFDQPGPGIAEANQLMCSKIGWCLRNTMPFQIVGRGKNQPVELEPWQADVTGYAIKLATTNGKVQTELCEVNRRIAGPKVENDVRMLFFEGWQKWHQALANKGGGCADADISTGGTHTRMGEHGVNICGAVQHSPCRSDQLFASVSRRNRMGRTM